MMCRRGQRTRPLGQSWKSCDQRTGQGKGLSQLADGREGVECRSARNMWLASREARVQSSVLHATLCRLVKTLVQGSTAVLLQEARPSSPHRYTKASVSALTSWPVLNARPAWQRHQGIMSGSAGEDGAQRCAATQGTKKENTCCAADSSATTAPADHALVACVHREETPLP